MTNPLNTPPLFNVEAEEATLGSLAIDGDAIERVRLYLKPGHFYREKHRWIYEAMLSLSDRSVPVDSITLCEELHGTGKLGDVGGPAFISSMMLYLPTALNVEHYARIVARDAMRRGVVGASERLRKMAYDDFADCDEATISSKAQAVIEQATRLELGASGATTITSSMDWLIEELASLEMGKTEAGLPVSLPSLRANLISAWRRGIMITVAARTSVGKSALMNHEAIELAKAGHAGLVIGLEMSIEYSTARGVAHLADLDSVQVVDGWKKRDNARLPDGTRVFPYRAESWDELRERVWEARQVWEGLPLAFVGISERDKTIQPPRTPRATRAFIKAHAARHPVDFVIQDYLGLMDYSPARTSSEVSRAIGDGAMLLRETAGEIGAVLFAVHQLNREAAKSERPALHHLAECGQLENHSDVVIFIHDEEKAGKKGAPKGHKELIVAKQRRGPTGYVDDIRVNAATGFWMCAATPLQQEQAERYDRHHANGNGRARGDIDF